ncbi:MAG: diphosphomevalonate decarboxylase, partial [Chloroflexi bacterium]|nr:diphosphomevalonate decarboxylase [Chloroflexota bacterium]
LYWIPETLAVIQAVREWRTRGLECYFSIDAGPNVHVLTTPDAAQETEARLCALPAVRDLIVSKVGGCARRSAEHLF